MKKIILFSFSFLLLICLSLTFVFKNAKAEWNDPEIEEVYDLNEAFVMPIMKFNDNGSLFEGVTTLEFPDGSIKNDSVVILDQMGIYTLHFVAQVGNKIKKSEVKFKVLGKYYVVSSQSFAKYDTSNATFKEKEIFTYDYAGEGLYVSLAQNDSIKFSKLIDITELSVNDTDPFIEAFVLPGTEGVYDFDHLLFTLTDSENKDITLTFTANRVTNNAEWARCTTYIMANGNGQYPTGAEYSGQTISKLHINDGWGTAFNHTFIKLNGNGEIYDPSTQPIRIWYDNKDLSAWVFSYGGSKVEIADMDDTYFFSNMWSGFPSGKVKLSISATDYNGNRKANFVIKKIKGLDLTETLFEDTNAPIISVDTEYDLLNMPEGVVDKPYFIPLATAKDDYDGERAVTTKVYYAYNTDGQIEFKIKNGDVIPDRSGNYAIEYTSLDTNGNLAKKVVFFHVGGKVDPITINIVGEKVTSIKVGHLLEIPRVELSGGSGKLKLEVSVSDDDNSYIVDNYTFRPEEYKTYTVKYTVTDYVGNIKEETYTVSTIIDNNSVFVDEIHLPKVFAANQSYTLPIYYLNNYSKGTLERVVAKYRITDSNGEKVYDALEKYIPSIESENGNVKVEIFDDTVSQEFIIPAIIPFTQKSPTVAAQVHFDRYFYTSNFEKTRSKNGITFNALDNYSGAEFIFANKLVAKAFRLDFKSFTGNLSSIDFILEDELDSKNVLKATVYKGSKGLGVFEVNGVRVDIEGIFNDGFTIGFNQNNEFYINTINLKVSDEFIGFSTEKAYLKVVFNDIEKDSTFTINRICGHTLSSATTDTFAPEIKVLGNYGGTYSIDTNYILKKAVSGDVFSINVNFTLSVLNPDGSYAKDINGIELNQVDPFKEYTLKLSEYGRYSVSYVSKEVDFGPSERAQESQFRYVINVNDREKPNLTITSTYTNYKVGDEIELPKYTLSDNKSDKENITVIKYIVNPSGIIKIAQGTSIIVSTEGTYEFRIMAIDEAGNIALEKVFVTVGGNE